MSNFVIPLQGGAVNAHQKFSVQLGDNLVEFELNYLQSGQWSCNLSIEGVVIAAGAMLEPNSDIIAVNQLSIGQLVFTGDDTTLDNLGANNTLTWVEP
jgi:hypothetical protein